MSVTTAPQSYSPRTVFVALAVAILAIAIAVALPFLLRSTKTVVVREGTPTTSSGTSAPSSYDAPTLRSAHGG